MEMPLIILKIVVLLEFCGIGDPCKTAAFLTLRCDKLGDKGFGEYSAFGKVCIILFKAVKWR